MALRDLARSLRLRHLLFLLLLFSGIIPLTLSSLLLTHQNRELLKTQEKSYLTRSAEFLSLELSDYLVTTRRQLAQLGASLDAAPGPRDLEDRLREAWVTRYLQGFILDNPQFLALRVLDPQGVGPRLAPADLAAPAVIALDTAFEQARSRSQPVYRFVVLPETNEPVTALAVPVAEDEDGRPQLFVQALARLRGIESVFRREAQGEVAVLLVDRGGDVLWSEGADPGMVEAVRGSQLVQDFVRYPLNLTAEHGLVVDGKRRSVLARVSPVEETGWGVMVHKPVATAFGTVRKMVWDTALSTGLLVVVAAVIAALAARRVSEPIQRLAETSHEIASGGFGTRVEPGGPGLEIRDLATNFNRMSGYVERSIAELQRAAQANRELFINSIRAFAAAIDAKDPYTRGHSERVAAVSRTIARHLGQGEDFQQRAWVASLLHDVGKIGVDDRILKKGGVLSAEEYDQMKQHPVIGAEILSPIEQLREMIPAVRWHHESWNGRGYPDGLKGEQIPLIARVVAVADCFDAVTTSRPYQRAYAPEFAVETIKKLTGTRFDAKVVTAFLKAFESGEIQVPRLKAATSLKLVAGRSVPSA